ncbi:MAG: hypothetical protein E6231_20110, partial [Bacillota bacterium]|nr:hypothetical protein [Bacillota bacterium]
LEINDKEILVDESNSFHERLMLDQGENTITVKAADGAGNVTTVVRTVLVGLESPAITNILPDEDISLREGDTLTVSFEAPTGGEGYFRLLMPFGLDSNEIGIPMTEEDGLYTGTWIAPAGLVATGLKVQVVYISEYGVKVTEMAEGRVTVIGNIKDLISNSMIIGDEAFDMDFLDNDASAQRKLTEWYNTGGEVYIKLNDTTIVNEEGEIIAIDELPDFITYFDIRGNVTYYEK